MQDADTSALKARAYLRLRRPDDARRQLELALRNYRLSQGSLLALQATAAIELAELGAPGWVGLGAALEVQGELAAGPLLDSVQIQIGDATFDAPVTSVAPAGQRRFSLVLPAPPREAVVKVSSRGVALLGSGLRLSTDFAMDGRADAKATGVFGWARIGWQPEQPVRLTFEDEYESRYCAATQRICGPGYRWPFRLDLRRVGLRGDRINISAELPDGRWQKLPDAPLLLPRAVRSPDPRKARLSRWDQAATLARKHRPHVLTRAPLVDVVIPVYRGRYETLACIDSVLTTIGHRGRVVVVDDATEDARLAAALDELAVSGQITLLRNEQNLGFVGAVNRALAQRSPNDVVLLNSDALVFGDWLVRLQAAAYSGERVGTVTPLSNDASIARYPNEFGAPMDPEAAAALDKLAAWTHKGISLEIPVGVGFCLYLRHDCLTEVGDLDAAAFASGYGEEVDFCLRARQRGWSHRIAADVFVYHAGGGSFGARRAALLERSQRLLNLRYPGYQRHIEGFIAQGGLQPIRRRLDERRLTAFDGRFVLLVTLALEGGVERFVTERRQQIRARGLSPLILKPQRPADSRRCELSTDAIDAPNLSYEVGTELAELAKLLSSLRIDEIEIHHFLNVDAAVIDTVRALGVRVRCDSP